jgi:hypothetical protein
MYYRSTFNDEIPFYKADFSKPVRGRPSYTIKTV